MFFDLKTRKKELERENAVKEKQKTVKVGVVFSLQGKLKEQVRCRRSEIECSRVYVAGEHKLIDLQCVTNKT